MALPTYLQLVNNVLVRMREPEVTTVNENSYSKMIGQLINDSLRATSDAFAWGAQDTVKVVSTIDGQYSGYTVPASGLRFKLTDVVNQTNFYHLRQIGTADYEALTRLVEVQQRGQPQYYLLGGTDSNGDTQVAFWPIPDNAYSIAFELNIPSTELENDTDTIVLPKEPIVLGAFARALVERGEDGGLNSAEAYQLFKNSLADHIALEAHRSPEHDAWEAV